MTIDTSLIGFKEALNLIHCYPEKDILDLPNESLVQIFNKAIEYLERKTEKLTTDPNLLCKFIKCVPNECASHPGLEKILTFIRDSNAYFLKDSSGIITPKLQAIFEEHISFGGREDIAIKLIEHGFPCSESMFALACCLDRIQVISAFVNMNLFIDKLKEPDSSGRTLVYYKVRTRYARFLEFLAKVYTPVEFKQELKKLDQSLGCSLFEYAIKIGDPNINKVIIEALPELAEELEQGVNQLIQADFQNYKQYRKGLKLAVPNSPILPKFKTLNEMENTENTILFLGKDCATLQRAWNLIAKYTAKIDPTIKIGECEMTKIFNPAFSKGRFTHYMDISQILPKPVRDIFGSSVSNGIPRNCHGAALVVSGVNSQLDDLASPDLGIGFKENMHQVPIENIELGDWVYIKDFPPGTLYAGCKGGHSFIYLDPDLCLSMNGYEKNLKFYRTQDVLNYYGFPVDALDVPQKDQENPWKKYISVYRKNENHISEPHIPGPA